MKRKSIDLLSPPFKGHLHPILAMGRVLAKDYDVKVVSSAAAESDIKAAGLQAILLNSIDDEALVNCVNPTYAVRSSPGKLLGQFKQVLSFFYQLKQELTDIYSRKRPDLIIADFTLPVAGIVADENSIDWWTSMPSPCVIECNGGPPSYLGGFKQSDKLSGKAKNWFGRRLVRLFKLTVALLCKKHITALNVKGIYRKDGTEAIYASERILCLGFQGLEFSRPWPKAVEFIGPMLYSPQRSDPKPYFDEKKRYILVTLGTHLDWCKESVFSEIASLASQFSNTVFHFSQGKVGSAPFPQSKDNLQCFSYINYQDDLPKYDFVIHHGGAGILYYCIQHAKPNIVLPQDYDQFDHAARLQAKGLAIWIKNIGQIKQALHALLNDHEARKRLVNFYDSCIDNQQGLSLTKLVKQKFH